MGYRLLQAVAAVVLVVGALGAGCDQLAGNTQPLTTSVAVGLINTTPYRAIFTVGAWEPLDRQSLPQFSNIRLEAKSADTPGQGVFEMDTAVLASGTAQFGCRRAISVGAADLIQQINNQKDLLAKVNPAFDITNKNAMITGVNFSDAALDSPDVDNPTVGTAEPLTANQGVDYPCGSAVIFTLVQDANAKGGFRIDSGTISN